MVTGLTGHPVNSASTETELLVIGGGLGGAMAAIAAAKQGKKVVVVEKAHVERSGAAATGNDHFGGVIIPGQSEWSVEELVEDHVAMAFGFANKDLVRNMAADSLARIKDLEAMGVEFRKNEEGKYHLIPQQHRLRSALYYVGRDIKPKLAQAMKRQGVKIVNRTMITALLINQGAVVGAMGFNVRSGSIQVFKAGAVIIATGGTTRMFPNPTGYFFNTYYPPSCTGDGLAMVLRAGGELANLEGVNRVRGPKNLERGGSGTYWPAKTVDARRKPLEYNFPGEAYYRWPAATARWTGEQIKRGEIQLPVFRDTPALTPEQVEHIEWGLHNEGMLLAARERRCSSSYHLHFRADYPDVDPPEWHKWLIVKKENGDSKTELRPIE